MATILQKQIGKCEQNMKRWKEDASVSIFSLRFYLSLCDRELVIVMNSQPSGQTATIKPPAGPTCRGKSLANGPWNRGESGWIRFFFKGDHSIHKVKHGLHMGNPWITWVSIYMTLTYIDYLQLFDVENGAVHCNDWQLEARNRQNPPGLGGIF